VDRREPVPPGRWWLQDAISPEGTGLVIIAHRRPRGPVVFAVGLGNGPALGPAAGAAAARGDPGPRPADGDQLDPRRRSERRVSPVLRRCGGRREADRRDGGRPAARKTSGTGCGSGARMAWPVPSGGRWLVWQPPSSRTDRPSSISRRTAAQLQQVAERAAKCQPGRLQFRVRGSLQKNLGTISDHATALLLLRQRLEAIE
jgi:hypothetical protein